MSTELVLVLTVSRPALDEFFTWKPVEESDPFLNIALPEGPRVNAVFVIPVA